MKFHWQHSIVSRSVGSLVVISFSVGLIIIAMASLISSRLTEQAAEHRLEELLETVESTVRVACYLSDEELATEVGRGLLKSSEVHSVRIFNRYSELVYLDRDGTPAPAGHPQERTIQRSIVSPFDYEEVVGRIELQPDAAYIATLSRTVRWQIALQAAILMGVVAVVMLLTMLYQVVRPIAGLSNAMHHINPAAGDQVVPPPGHEHNEIGRLASDINDLTAQLVATLHEEQSLRRQHEVDERKYRGIFDNADSGIFVADWRGHLESYNRSFARLTGLVAEYPSPGSTINALPWLVPMAAHALIERSLAENGTVSDDLELAIDATSHWLNLSLTPVGENLVQGIVTDVTLRRQAENSARLMAVTDPLTGLTNRRGFEYLVREGILAEPEQAFAVILVDINGFKQFNEAFGFTAGDGVLTEAAARLRHCLKASDLVARIGGDEFCIRLIGADPKSAAATVAQRIGQALGEEYALIEHRPLLGASLGIALYPLDGEDLPTLLRNAELALDEVRSEGSRPPYRLYAPRMSEQVEHRQSLASDLRLAASQGALELYYQPIVDLQRRRVSGAEALLRWHHPEQGMIPPDSFIPLAEKAGLIEDIGRWCLEETCRQLGEWQRAGLDLCVTLNVSARQIPDGLPVSTIKAAAERHGVMPHCLGLEITEGLLLDDFTGAQTWLEEARAQGFQVYLDDFGTGYSSLSYLKRFRVDKVKIDKSFIRDIIHEDCDRALVGAVIILANSLGFDVLAEGIETAEQAAFLTDISCHYGQGYHFSRPVPAREFPGAIERIAGQLAD